LLVATPKKGRADEEDDEDDNSGLPLRPLLEQMEFRYRHWLSLDPPNEEFTQKAVEQDRRQAILDEYAQRTQEAKNDSQTPS
jgi:hypothetical protein